MRNREDSDGPIAESVGAEFERDLSPNSSLDDDIREIFDDERADTEARNRAYGFHTFKVPALRMFGATVFMPAAVLLHHLAWGLPGELGAVGSYLLAGIAYGTVSWIVLRRFYRPFTRFNLALVFLVSDFALLGAATYVTGVDRSWLMFLPLVLVADQVHSNLRRVIVFAHLAPLSYAGVLAWAAWHDGATFSWTAEGIKLVVLYFAALHVSSTVDITMRLRARTRRLLATSRSLIARLQEQTQELEQSKRDVENASELKNRFLANVSHEIRTPMNGILGMTELALDGEVSDEQRDYLKTIKSSADALLSIINDILDFSKIEAGRMDLESVPFGLEASLREWIRPFEIRASQRGVELILDLDPTLPERIMGDPGRMRQIVVNLVGNAIKFTAKGEVSVRARREPGDGGDSRLVLEVADSGIGIPTAKLGAIFDAFAQADGSTTRKFGGTGLGLTICRHLTELMEGTISVDSRVGAGTTFRVDVPLVAADGSAEAAPAPVDELVDLPVLIVDDHPINRRILTETARGWGARPHAVADAKEAMEAAVRAAEGDGRFRLVLVDGHMPGRDGFQLAGDIRKDPLLGDPAIVMLTSGGQRGDGARCRELGIRGYLTKPVAPGDLLKAVLQVLGTEDGDEAAPLVTRHSVRESRPGLSILVAEDNLINRRVVVRMLEKYGHKVTTVENGVEALQELGKTRFDVVLMDIQMPRMDGIEATTALRAGEAETGRRIPVIALTAHAMKGDRQRFLDAGMDGYVSKPLDSTELATEIERVTSMGAKTSPQAARETGT